ncbi:MAG: Flp pilus assembly protein CpaB [Proteobacteria bacterium]|nr:Flp pilus assembly protein CpaB [Pseudomonadota bacterium]
MRSSRLIVGGIAGIAALGAWLLSGPAPQPQTPEPQVQAAAPAKTIDVLVAAVDIPMGGPLSQQDLKWIGFPEGADIANYITRTEGQDPTGELIGSVARHAFLAGEPIRREKLIKGNGSGFLSAILPSGKRAVAITTDGTGATSAGGFVLPNDMVDVLRVSRDEEASRLKGVEVFRSDTIVSNVRVLAVGQNVQERNGERFIVGQTATLELEPRQAEQVVLAQRVGTLALALRALVDANKPEDVSRPVGKGLTVVRFGLAQEAVVK